MQQRQVVFRGFSGFFAAATSRAICARRTVRAHSAMPVSLCKSLICECCAGVSGIRSTSLFLLSGDFLILAMMAKL